MHCEICDQFNRQYAAAVDALHVANQHQRVAKLGTLQFALSRREVHESLSALIAAEGELQAHRAWHVAVVTVVPRTHTAIL